MGSIMDSKGNQQKHSMLYVSNPFVVPGGRFRELRYWDSYWIVRGLLASGMTSSVRNICKNFAELIDRFGFVPAGNRIFYSKRSQPPFHVREYGDAGPSVPPNWRQSKIQGLPRKKEHGIWYDYNMDSGTLNEAYYGSVAMPLFVRCYDTIDLGTAERMFQRLELFDKQHKLLGHPFGVPVSITVNSSQQWDFPNILPPSQHMLIEGLRRSSNKRMEDKAKEMAQKWVSANYNLFQNCLRQMWEKMAAHTGTPGSGGEYNAQMGFGWTNGAMLDLLVTYGDVLKLKGVPKIDCSLKNLVQEPEQYPNNVSEYRAQRFMEEQKKVDEINRSQNYWTAVVYERFALMTDEELRQLTGSIIRNRTRKPKPQFKQAMDPIDYGDLPKTFDARQKWPECADFIGKMTAQGYCGSCWAVSAASTFTDRICIARLKKGIKTDSKDPRSYVSAQYTLECAPNTNQYNGTDPTRAWELYRDNGTVACTDNAMLSGCKHSCPWRLGETAKQTLSCEKTCNAQWLEKQFGKEKVPYEPFLTGK
uniref:Trehalase n=1 Tax=Globodera pallida TaxID=36090 RepID=A0A183CKB1_GLOPA